MKIKRSIYKKYRVAIIAKTLSEPNQKLIAAAKSMGLGVDFIPVPFVPISNFKQSNLLKKILEYDTLYYRTGMRGSMLDELVHHTKKNKKMCVNCNERYPYLHKKIRQALIANRFDIPQPKGIYIQNRSYEEIIKNIGSPFVIKPNEGAHGTEVTLIKSSKDYDLFKENKKKERYYYQEYISDATEYRVYTLGGKAIATYKKTSAEGDFRGNIHTGGSISKTEPEIEMSLKKAGEQIALAFGADIAGIDILYKNKKFLFLEMNFQPGWNFVEEITNVNFAEETIKFLFEKTHSSKSLLGRMLSK